MAAAPRYELVSGDFATPTTLAEVTQLWWFCDGAIMDASARKQLHRSWGLCPRHAWLYFRSENELKYQPLGNAVLYRDLTGRAAELLGSRHRRHTKWRRLAAAGICLTCDYLSISPHGADRFAGDLANVHAGTRTRSWLNGSTEVWQARHCPQCPATSTALRPAPGGPSSDLSCRIHLLTGAVDHEPAETCRYLEALTARLTSCVKTMTAEGPARTPDTDAALVEALAWFSGWPPLRGWTDASVT